MVCWHASKCSVVVYIFEGCRFMSVLLFNDGPDVQIVFYMYVNLAVGSVWSGGGGSVLGLQPSSLDKKITL